MKNEPAVTIGTITAAVSAVIGLLVAFGFNVNDAQVAAITAVVSVLGPIVAAIITRSKVTPVGKVDPPSAPSSNGTQPPTP